MSFLTTNRLLSKPAKLNQLSGYIFDLLFIVALWSCVSDFHKLHVLATSAPIAVIPKQTFVFFGGLGIYGLRVATYIAMIRRNRAPQVLEWLVTIIPMALAAPCFLFSGPLVRLDASLHHYRFCYRETSRAPNYVFAAPTAKCPPLPDGAVPF